MKTFAQCWRRLRIGALLVVALLLGGCGDTTATTATAPSGQATPAAAAASPTSAAAPPTQATTPTAGAAEFQNPVLRQDFADPGVTQVGDTYYAYATNANGKNIQVARSTDLVGWEVLTDAMPALPKWARLGGSLVWAPEMIPLGEQYLLYYTARDKASDKQCIGVAVAGKPEGKFKDSSDQPLVCQAAEGGSIDPHPFRDGDKLYLYWKNDGNCCAKPTYLYVQELAVDGLSLVGEPVRLVRNDATWEGTLIEAPTMIKRDSLYYLFFSANYYSGEKYAVGYATCQTAVGPCEDAPENPILSSVMTQNPPVVGPGHQTVLQIGDETWMVYHAWEIISSGLRGDRRFLWLDQIEWVDGKPDVLGPTTDPQPRPGM